MKQNQKKNLVKICVLAMLSAIAFVLYLLEFPIAPPAVGHLKMDLSDIPALFGAIVYGPGAGVVIELVKNLIELLVKGVGTQMGFGNLMNFLVGCAFVVPFSLVSAAFAKKQQENKGLIVGCVVGVVSIVLVGLGANYLITPLFFKYFLGIDLDSATLWTAIGSATVLNVIKGVLLSVVSIPMVKVLVKRIGKLIEK
ncbi:MAG: ECF transporter S component [Oscillospiraceae bacterium]|nr:ECF transporter S component [Oscillospiraceae bacterium]